VLILIIDLNIRKQIISISVLGNTICTLAISVITNYYALLVARFFNGFCVVACAIFIPVWVDQFAPVSTKSVIMAIHHLESILATITGFLMTSRISQVMSWRYSWVIQGMLLGTFFFIVLMMSKIMFSRSIQRIRDTEIFIISEIHEKEIEDASPETPVKVKPIKEELSISVELSNIYGNNVSNLRGQTNVNDLEDDNKSKSVNSKLEEGKPNHGYFETMQLLSKNPVRFILFKIIYTYNMKLDLHLTCSCNIFNSFHFYCSISMDKTLLN
jgi:hypothetical protein